MDASHKAVTEPTPRGLRRLHLALMPDYNVKAAAYWYTVVALGAAALVHTLSSVVTLSAAQIGQTALGIVITTFAGMFPVRIPRSKNSVASGEIFIFLMLLMLGPAAATLAAASEAGVATWRTSRRWSSRIASPAMAAIALTACGAAFQAVAEHVRAVPTLSEGLLVGAVMLMAAVYYVVNALLVAAVPHLKRNEPMLPWPLLRNQGWIGLAYVVSASIAGLLYLTSVQFGVSVLVAAAPVIALFLLTLHYYFGRQEADEEIRRARLEAAEREAGQAARHVRELEESERRFHSAFTHASIGMALVAFDGRVLQVNQALRTLLGADEAAIVGRPFNEYVCAEDVEALGQQLASVDERTIDSFAVELRCRHREGHEVWVALHCSFFSEPGSAVPCLILQAQDISARRHAEHRLQHIAFHDSLTSLPNRSRFHEFLSQAIARARLSERCQFAVMFLDFDRFKLINDSMGHSAGDEFLVQVTRRIRDNVRPSDVVARLGGDEFAILCHDIATEDAVVQLAERLQQALRVPLQIAGNEISTSASIGITFSAFGYSTPEEVLRDADIAMYQAKAGGKARHALFDSGLRLQVSDRVKLERDLRRAVAEGQLSAAYQPLFDLASGRIEAFEVLARWPHPGRGLVSPGAFIPLAEETGMILAITDAMLERACSQLAHWQRLSPAFADLRMQINISGNDLANNALVDRVRRALERAGLEGRHLTLELTENILMERLESGVEQLERLRALGVGISIDDFGTGYSSLSCLSRLPIDSLKIDRSFVQNLRVKSKEAEIVRAVVSLAGSLGKAVIAEGIETDAQLQMLRTIGCEVGQGYHLSHPLAPERAEALLAGLEVRGARTPSAARQPQLALLH
jgi:diguanylate cyclase (GGDEF)-like protein/PAS domain S-box-containing protein